MRLSKIIQFAVVVTIISLIYIHMQMKIYSLAYDGKDKEKEIIGLSETNQKVSYDILELKSANHLGGQLLREASNLRFSDYSSVIQLVTTESVSQQEPMTVAQKRKAGHPLLSLFSLKPPTEAYAEERDRLPRPWRRK